MAKGGEHRTKLESLSHKRHQIRFFSQRISQLMSLEQDTLCYIFKHSLKQISFSYALWYLLILSSLVSLQPCPDKSFGLVAAQGFKLLTWSWSVLAANCSVSNQRQPWRQRLLSHSVSMPLLSILLRLVVIGTAVCLRPGWNSRTRKSRTYANLQGPRSAESESDEQQKRKIHESPRRI